MSDLNLSETNKMFLELFGDLLARAPDVLKSCVLGFREVPALTEIGHPISIHPVILRSLDPTASIKCMLIARECHKQILIHYKPATQLT